MEVVGLGDVEEYPEAPETGATFADNALLKAREAARYTGLPAVADDSGLTVDALNGMPGVLSARWSGRHGDDDANTALLLGQLADVPDERRGAAFVCAAALVTPDGTERVLERQWRGRVIAREAGHQRVRLRPGVRARGARRHLGRAGAGREGRPQPPRAGVRRAGAGDRRGAGRPIERAPVHAASVLLRLEAEPVEGVDVVAGRVEGRAGPLRLGMPTRPGRDLLAGQVFDDIGHLGRAVPPAGRGRRRGVHGPGEGSLHPGGRGHGAAHAPFVGRERLRPQRSVGDPTRKGEDRRPLVCSAGRIDPALGALAVASGLEVLRVGLRGRVVVRVDAALHQSLVRIGSLARREVDDDAGLTGDVAHAERVSTGTRGQQDLRSGHDGACHGQSKGCSLHGSWPPPAEQRASLPSAAVRRRGRCIPGRSATMRRPSRNAGSRTGGCLDAYGP